MKRIGLLGEKLGHSYSKLVHEALRDNPYLLFEVPQEKFDEFMKKKEFDAINVTIPYKEKVLPYLDFISDMAKRIGAVNTIVNRNGKLYGYNTDYDGFKYLALYTEFDFPSSKCLILGDGGTSKTVREVLKDLKTKEIFVATRKVIADLPEEDGIKFINYKKIDYNKFDYIINATPVGMYPNIDECIVEGPLKSVKGIIDVIYNPYRTKLHFINEDIEYFSGTKMLTYQAAKSQKIFFGENSEIDENAVLQIEENIRDKVGNFVLIGMPGSGKTTVGKKIQEILGYKFIDTDILVEKYSGYTIEEIFSKFGEKKFREYEAMVIKEVALSTKSVIATGGGVVLSKENMDLLRANGSVIYLERDIEVILNGFDYSRPLAQNEKQVRKLYKERKDLYEKYADMKFDPINLIRTLKLLAASRKR